MQLAGDRKVELTAGELRLLGGFIGWGGTSEIVDPRELERHLAVERCVLLGRGDAGELALAFVTDLVHEALAMVEGGHA